MWAANSFSAAMADSVEVAWKRGLEGAEPLGASSAWGAIVKVVVVVMVVMPKGRRRVSLCNLPACRDK